MKTSMHCYAFELGVGDGREGTATRTFTSPSRIKRAVMILRVRVDLLDDI